MNVDLVCTDSTHPVNTVIKDWIEQEESVHCFRLFDSKADLSGGDLLFLVSCHEFIGSDIRKLYRTTFVLHASDLPNGRGWSPHIWTILNGSNEIVVTLLEAADKIDSGDIWAQQRVIFQGHELYDEINAAIFEAELNLIKFAVHSYTEIKKHPQPDSQSKYFRRRTPEDSFIDPKLSIADQFELLRVADPNRYPAFFHFRGQRFLIKITKDQSNE